MPGHACRVPSQHLDPGPAKRLAHRRERIDHSDDALVASTLGAGSAARTALQEIGSRMIIEHPLHLTVFGATGSIGRHVLEQALGQGHRVTAFTRHPGRIEPATGLEVSVCGVLEPAAVRTAVEGRDAVVVALGDGRRGEVREAGPTTTAHTVAPPHASSRPQYACRHSRDDGFGGRAPR